MEQTSMKSDRAGFHAQGILKSASLPISPYGFEYSIKKTLSPTVCPEILCVELGWEY